MRKLVLWLLSLAIVSSCAFLLPSVFGWGAHRYHADLVRQIATAHIKQADGTDCFSRRDWNEYVELYSYYPDYGGDFSAPMRKDEMWNHYLTTLAQNRATATHSLRNSVVYFKLLLDSFAAGENRKAAVWSGCLTHVIGDAVAANHPPLLSYLTYAYGPMGMTVGSSGERLSQHVGLIDVVGPCQDELGKKLLQEGMKDYRPTVLGETAEEAAIRLQLILQESWHVALQEEARIARGLELWIEKKDPEGREMLQRGMAALTIKCTRDAANIIYTAQVLSRKKQTIDVEAVITKARPRVMDLIQSLPLSQVSEYAGLLKETSSSPAVGVFLAPPPLYWVTSGGSIDLPQCYFQGLIARTLQEQGRPYVTFDIRHHPKSLDPKKVPVVVLPYYRNADGLKTEELEKVLRAYRKAGGKVLYVGGYPAPAIEPLMQCIMPSPDKEGPYPMKSKEMPGKKLVMLDPKAKAVVEALSIVRIMHDFDTRGNGMFVVKPGSPAAVRPLMVLDAGTKKLTVSAGYWEGDSLQVLYAPWYVFLPGSLTQATELRNFHQPSLDASGRKILDHLLSLLHGPFVRAP